LGRHQGIAAAIRVIAAQYLGFTAILTISIAGAVIGATLLPPAVPPYFGLLPIILGLRAAWIAWQQNRRSEPVSAECAARRPGPGVWQVAAVTFANGGDNIGVYVLIFTLATNATISVYATVFLVGVAICCAAGRYFASHPVIAKGLSRWGHVVLPAALISIGAAILFTSGAFGL
jgi:cadmium resistance protein CadD (predicted permease)